jgi:hypothetical protein
MLLDSGEQAVTMPLQQRINRNRAAETSLMTSILRKKRFAIVTVSSFFEWIKAAMAGTWT